MMFDAAPPISPMQRAVGRAGVSLDLRGGRVRLDRLQQSGSAKAFLPQVHSGVPEVVFLNTAGGLTGGDHLRYALEVGAGAAAVATTQTAERAYRSGAGRAVMDVALTVGAGARLDWLPQETIVFDRSALARRTVVEMAPDARLLLAEMIVLGRAAMGETVAAVDFSDWREVRRGGVPVWIEPLRLTGASLRGQAALLGSARAVATVALIAPDAEAALAPVRAVLSGVAAFSGLEAGASAFGGKCLVRFAGAEAFPLRRAVVAVLECLRGGPVPRVWQV